jgi:hypothetical protein
MSFFFGPRGQKVKPQFTGLQTQTSTGAVPIPLCYGENRLAPNIIWQGDFQSHKQEQKAGKGGGGSTTTYTYSASFQLGMCWGPIHGITRAWKDQEKKDSYTGYGFSLQLGTNPQSPWGYMTASHPTEALGYSDIAVLSVANYDLGQSNTFGQHSFQTQALLWQTGIGGTAVGDADPALVIEDFLENPTHGIGLDLSGFSNLLSTADAPTIGDSAYQTYCQAMGFALSPFLVSQENAKSIIQRWLELTNTAPVWTGYTLKFHPYGPDTVTANGVTYLPDFPVRYELTDIDFIFEKGSDPIKFNRSDPSDAYNKLSIVIANKNNEFNDLPVTWRDQGLIDQFGERKADNEDTKEVTDPLMAAIMVAIMGQRQAYIRNSFEFKLGVKYCRVEPMDILGCTDPRLGHFYVLVKEANEDEDGKFDIVAEEYPASVSSAPVNSTQAGSNNPVNTAVDPGPVNPPIIFEPPALLSGTPQVWAAVSGGDGTNDDPNWGGCFVWISTDDITYNNIGQIDTPARMGKLTALLATYASANPDTAHTLAVNLSMSDGELSDAASPSDAAAGVTASYIDGEILSYENTTLTGANSYNCTNLYRALYGTTVGAHAIGTNFARLDDAVFKFDLTDDYIGKTLYLKFQSYNIFGGAAEDLASCTAYVVVPAGTGFGTGAGGLPSAPTGLSGSAGLGFAKLVWNTNSLNDNVQNYEIWRAPGPGGSFGSAVRIGVVPGTTYTDTSGAYATQYTYFVVAVNSIGSSSPSSGVDLTSTQPTTTQPFGFAFGPKTPVISKILGAFDTPIAWTIPAGLADSQGTIVDSDSATATAPTAQTDFDIQSPPGTSIGTMRFAIGSLTATFIKAASSSVPLGQITQIVAPANINGILGAIAGSVKGTR